MKKILIVVAIAGAIYYLNSNFSFQNEHTGSTGGYTGSTSGIPAKSAEKHNPPMRVIFFQDVSKSNLSNGVDLVSSEIFMPYYDEVEKEIELSFGCIDISSAKKLITIRLHSKEFIKPHMPDISKASIVKKRKMNETYSDALKQYVVDSIQYYSDRTNSIQTFRSKVDSVLEQFRDTLSGQTDLATAITNADKVFETSKFDQATSFLILNSDGLDSYKKVVNKMNNKATVILVNAGPIYRTSIDSIITLTLESPEAAIQYSLHSPITKN